MKVEVRLYAGLNKYVKGKNLEVGESWEIELPDGATALNLVEALGIPPAQVHAILVNGCRVEPDELLPEGARVGIFPAVGGG